MIRIRPFEQSDWAKLWPILKEAFRSGDSYAFSPEISADEAYQAWIEAPAATFVAVDAEDRVVGTYYIKPNQPSLGAHVCNCGYIVAKPARKQGIASAMCQHSQAEALNMGFRSMQYNLVVASNEGAVRLWKKHGFLVVGTLPEAFHHQRLGYVDALVMYKQLGR